MINYSILQNIFIGLIVVFLTTIAALAPTPAFTYQGKLTGFLFQNFRIDGAFISNPTNFTMRLPSHSNDR
jgi:hypothetical protein